MHFFRFHRRIHSFHRALLIDDVRDLIRRRRVAGVQQLHRRRHGRGVRAVEGLLPGHRQVRRALQQVSERASSDPQLASFSIVQSCSLMVTVGTL